MSVVENFSRMASHMVNGMMVHEQLINAYLFLGLKGYAECHKYHYLEETKSYISLCEYSVEHFDQIITARINPDGIPEIIPISLLLLWNIPCSFLWMRFPFLRLA